MATTRGRARWLTRAVAALGTLALASGVAVATAETAQARDGSHFLRIRTSGNVNSVFVSGRGWTAYDIVGQGYSTLTTRGLDTCYMYVGDNSASPWVSVNSGLIAHTNQAPGIQSIAPVNGAQRSNPAWIDGTPLTITTYTSRDCTQGQTARYLDVRVPENDLVYTWTDLTG
ncbi:hypothetical protein ACIBFB_13510 [Nocardiopsis sp. NPDC050513]|uniref:hypothetical protein n=1 Tax=Nocardiopsis sp. NPDC050513 TaxID=3364338 RepID=UPI0037AD01F6